MNVASPVGGAARHASCRPPTSRSRTARRCWARWAPSRCALRNYLDAADTASTLAAVQALGARVERRDDAARDPRRRPARGGARRGDRRRQRGHAAAAAAGLARRARGAELDARRRREHPPPAGRPRRRSRCRGWARSSRPATAACRRCGRGPALRGIEYELPVASAQVKSCVLLAGLLADGETTVIEPSRAATTPSGCSRAPAPGSTATARASWCRPDDLLLDAIECRATPRRRLPRGRGGARARLAARGGGDGGELDARRLLPDPRAMGAGVAALEETRRRRTPSRCASSTSRTASPRRA